MIKHYWKKDLIRSQTKLFTLTMKLVSISTLLTIHSMIGQISLVFIKLIIRPGAKMVDMLLEGEYQQSGSDQGTINCMFAVLLVPMVIIAGTRQNTQLENGLT